MTQIGTPNSATATRVLLCGGGELGKEVVIELQRFGVEVIVVDRYPNSPAMQVDGDYRQSWQPQKMTEAALNKARETAKIVTDALGGRGIFGVELFIKGDEVIFSEVSPRPHDTGMVTMISQDLSQFALHARAILGLPIPAIRQFGPSASSVILVEGKSSQVLFSGLDSALAEPDTQLRLFGKPEVDGHRRMGVGLARADSIEKAVAKAEAVSRAVSIKL